MQETEESKTRNPLAVSWEGVSFTIIFEEKILEMHFLIQ